MYLLTVPARALAFAVPFRRLAILIILGIVAVLINLVLSSLFAEAPNAYSSQWVLAGLIALDIVAPLAAVIFARPVSR